MRAIDLGVCDVVMLPVGPCVDRRYVDEVLPRARAKGVGTISFKTFGAGKLVADTLGYGRPMHDGAPLGRALPALTPEECVRCVLTIGPDVALVGCSTAEEQDAAMRGAWTFAPMTDAELEDVRRRAWIAIEGKGARWWDPA